MQELTYHWNCRACALYRSRPTKSIPNEWDGWAWRAAENAKAILSWLSVSSVMATRRKIRRTLNSLIHEMQRPNMCARAGSALRLNAGSHPIGGRGKVDTAGDEVVEVRLNASGKRSPLLVRTTETVPDCALRASPALATAAAKPGATSPTWCCLARSRGLAQGPMNSHVESCADHPIAPSDGGNNYDLAYPDAHRNLYRPRN